MRFEHSSILFAPKTSNNRKVAIFDENVYFYLKHKKALAMVL